MKGLTNPQRVKRLAAAALPACVALLASTGLATAQIYGPPQTQTYAPARLLQKVGIDQKMGALAASPLPQLDTLKKTFSFEKIPAKKLLPEADEARHLALRMRPTDPEIKKHVEEVTVVLDVASGFVVRAQTIDPDGDRIVLSFTNPKINTGLKDAELELHVPAGVTVTRPLEGK